MSKNIQIQQENVLNAYKNASDEQKELLEHLFGSEVFKPADVRERIKTFADAAKAVGIEDPEEWEEQYSDLVVICFQNCIFDISKTAQCVYCVGNQRIIMSVRKEKSLCFRLRIPSNRRDSFILK